MEKFREMIGYFNPILFYYALIYGATKIYELISGSENIWQGVWNKFIDIVGDNEAFHVVVILNIYTITIYWVLGGILMTMQRLRMPKSLENFKIQANESEIVNGENLANVRPSRCQRSTFNSVFFFHLHIHRLSKL
jgi:hypothetical protein